MASYDIRKEIAKGDWKEDFSSSHIKAVMWLRDFDSTQRIGSAVGRMYVEFTDKKIYLYFDVPYSAFYYLWKRASSKGSYFNRHLRATQENKIFEYLGSMNTGIGRR